MKDRALILETLEQTRWVVGGTRGAAAKLGLKRARWSNSPFLRRCHRDCRRPYSSDGRKFARNSRGRGLVAFDSPSQGYEVENPQHHERALQPRHSVGVHGQESDHGPSPWIGCASKRETRTYPRSA